jgi:PepSY-associated TM region
MNGLWRTLVITHRYLGVAVGLLMAVWFASGIVLMYVGFPRVTEDARMRALTPIAWAACCRFGDAPAGDETIPLAQVENLAGMPALRLQRPGRRDSALDLAQGAPMPIDAERALAVALDAAPRIIGRPAKPVDSELAQADQWTVGRLVRDRPLYRFAFDDPERTNIYVSSMAGQVVHWTTATERFWNWLGTIPHFIYFADLRSNVALWSQIVIWTSLLGTFLTVVGLYLGIAQFKRGSGGKLSPYRGWFYWHHVTGLVFGLVTLTWVFSGLLSMNPWGFLESGRGGGEQARLRGPPPKWQELRASLDAIRARPSLAEAVSLTTAPLAGQLFWVATLRDGTAVRLDVQGNIAAPTAADLAGAAERIAGPAAIAEQGLIADEDSYYFKQRRERLVLPVYRIILGDADRTRYYLDPGSGVLLQRFDGNRRWQRWLFDGLHRLDFTASMRSPAFRNVVVLALMLGGLGLSATGVYLAIRSSGSDLATLWRWTGRRMTAIRQSGNPPRPVFGPRTDQPARRRSSDPD